MTSMNEYDLDSKHNIIENPTKLPYIQWIENDHSYIAYSKDRRSARLKLKYKRQLRHKPLIPTTFAVYSDEIYWIQGKMEDFGSY